MSHSTHLLLPDRWRIELMRQPDARDAWLTALEAHPGLRLLDWEAPRPAAGELVIVAGLDLAAAELVLKLPPEVKVFATDTSWASLPWGGRAEFLRRAERRVQRRLTVPHRNHSLPAAPGPFLAALLGEAGVAS